MLRSSTFIIGILLAVGAFVALLLLGTVLNPPPYQVVVARADIPAYSRITSDLLALDSQTMSREVAASLITRDELDQYLGSLTIETIRAGEPLRKGSIVSATNPSAANRLALMLDDAHSVAMVIPVDPKTAPEQIQTGDYVDIVLSLTPGAINANTTEIFGDALPTPNAVSPILPRPTRAITVTTTLSSTVLAPEEMNLPVAKVTIRHAPILAVRRERIANPNFAVAPIGEGERASEPAYVEGDIQAVLVRVPRESAELLTFGMDNGKVHLSLLSPHLVENQQDAPTLGMSWNDVITWMMEERRRASGQVVVVTASTSPKVTFTPTLITNSQTLATPTLVASQAITVSGISSPLSMPTFDVSLNLFNSVAFVALPLGVGILLVIGAFYFIRRLKS